MHRPLGLRPLARLVSAAALFLLAGCASTRPPLILVPTSSVQRTVFYQRGRPIAAIRRDSILALVSCEPAELFGRRYLRVWLLYVNRSATGVLIDPLREVAVVSTNMKSLSSNTSSPELPHRLLAEAENRRQMALVATSIGGALRTAAAALSARNTEAGTTGNLTSPSGEATRLSTTTVINDAGEKAAAESRRIDEETRTAQRETNEAYVAFERSLNAGVLRKHTVFPGDGVNGFLYIPLVLEATQLHDSVLPARYYAYTDYWQLEEVRHVVMLNLPMLADTVAFVPEVGD